MNRRLLQMGLIRGLLSAVTVDASPSQLRGQAFAIYDVAVGIATLIAGIGAGALWVAGGAAATFSARRSSRPSPHSFCSSGQRQKLVGASP
jgi:hypothetical protein